MGSKIEYVDSSQMVATSYVRNSKAIAVLWAIFTICYAIISAVAFVTPEWLGHADSEFPARFGVWRVCTYGAEECTGHLQDLSSVPGPTFRIATLFCAASILVAALTVLAMLLFFFVASTTVFKTCCVLQLISGITLIIGVCVYPLGWDSEIVQRTCGQKANKYALGDCSLKWAYFLAIIGCLDALILATLAFILATRHVKLQPEATYNSGSLYKGEVNGGFMGDGQSMAGSRKSLNLHPVLLMPQPGDMDRFSEFSNRTGRSKSSLYRGDYAASMHNFQL